MTTVKLLAFAGSAKQASLNKKILSVAVTGALQAGAEVTTVDLRDYPMPMMDEELEARDGLPDNAAELRRLFSDHDGLLLACPEYNGSITPLLKNTLDWVSRPDADGSGLRFYKGKPAALVSASGGALGGLRGLVHVRAILGNLGMIVLPGQVAVGGASKLFDDSGEMTDSAKADQLKTVGATLAEVTGKLAP